MATLSPTRALSSESSFGGAADTFSNVASLSSTPPTTVADTISLASDASKHDNAPTSDPIEVSIDDVVGGFDPAAPADADKVAEAIEAVVSVEAEPPTTTTTPADTPSRARRHRDSIPVYNLSQLSGTAGHGKRRSKGDVILNRRRRTSVSGDDDREKSLAGAADNLVRDGIDALDMKWSIEALESPKHKNIKKAQSISEQRRATRSSGLPAVKIAKKISTLGKRSRDVFEQGLSKMSRELKRLQDTNEYAGIDLKPVLYTTWAKGKFVDPHAVEPARKKVKVAVSPKRAVPERPEAAAPEAPTPRKRRIKRWMDHGLYSGQDAPADVSRHLTSNERKALTEMPELQPIAKVNSVLPMPIFNGLRTLINGRDFKLPFDVCNPLPPGQPKPESFRMMTRNRFVGNAGALWKKTDHFKDYQSKCVCTPDDGCGESCQNRIMLYECDTTNCNAGAQYCQNRAFARLQERVKAGGKYRVGVEVLKTEDRGYGIRSNRCFEPGQIIMEYTGEIITEDECDERMKNKYKDNKCYYLMSFDQGMIIDATIGSIARFVNHSCQPNCQMIKWIVSGQPRMALFAGDRPIMTGEELTYDYNFDPFSAKNVQQCLCGSPNCRGVLGPKPKEVKPPKESKEDLKKSVKKGVKAGKRKLKELIGDKADTAAKAKKRKVKPATGTKGKGIKRSLSSAGAKAARGAAKVVKKSVSTISVKTPKAGGKLATIKRKSSIVKTYSKNKAAGTPKKAAARKTSLTIVAASTSLKGNKKNASSVKGTPGKKTAPKATSTPTGKARPRKPTASVTPRKGVDLARKSNQIRLVQSPSENA
ncbi:hypothetical protein BX600DRAFT_442663 [Xylariales sp. PMI_506]|nr:hypothetical protein BX600DRAFT_442663 [Xylariales sp. PMI_506]